MDDNIEKVIVSTSADVDGSKLFILHSHISNRGDSACFSVAEALMLYAELHNFLFAEKKVDKNLET